MLLCPCSLPAWAEPEIQPLVEPLEQGSFISPKL
ncbi:hypothetical protein DFAR_2500020 [Desulfarculales bacterium]